MQSVNTLEKQKRGESARQLMANRVEYAADSCLHAPAETPQEFHIEIMIVNVSERIRQVDQVANKTSVSISSLTPEELEPAHKLCEHFEL